MAEGQASSGSPEVPVVFPGVPWLRDGTKFDLYLESCLSHARNQDAEVEVLPVVLTEPIDDDVEITKKNQMDLVTPKLNELVDEMFETDATHLWFLNADTEVPSHALRSLLSLKGAVVSGVSPMHHDWRWSDVHIWVPAPTPDRLYSEPYFKRLPLDAIRGKVFGGDVMVATGHFCMLVERAVLEQFRFRWRPVKTIHCRGCGGEVSYRYQRQGSELTFWMDAYMLGFMTYIDGRVLCGHLPEFPLSEYVVDGR